LVLVIAVASVDADVMYGNKHLLESNHSREEQRNTTIRKDAKLSLNKGRQQFYGPFSCACSSAVWRETPKKHLPVRIAIPFCVRT